MREANEGWAGYIRRLIDNRYDGNQSSLAQDIGVAASTVTRWIDGATPTIGALHDISSALDVPMTDLLIAAGALNKREISTDAGTRTPTKIADVAEAIRQDGALIEEARLHLLNQYELLRRLSEQPASKDRSLRVVARKRPTRKP